MAKIYVVGIGPGDIEDMTPKARNAIEESDVIIGYATYVDLVKNHFPGKEFISTGMTKEVERCRTALEKAHEGCSVALLSSGDSGVYGMAGIMLEVAGAESADADVCIVPGITAAVSAASLLGAPLMHDFSVISLSDLLTPWELIQKRIECAAQGDFVICFYNPKSKGRARHIETARDLVLRYRSPETPVGIVRNAGRNGQSSFITTLEKMLEHRIDMQTVVIVGNSQTYVKNGRMITPRGYRIG